jgi:hypothetical protein
MSVYAIFRASGTRWPLPSLRQRRTSTTCRGDLGWVAGPIAASEQRGQASAAPLTSTLTVEAVGVEADFHRDNTDRKDGTTCR